MAGSTRTRKEKSAEADIRSQVRKAYGQHARTASQNSCCRPNTATTQAGYTGDQLESLPDSAKAIAAGCGNPTAVAGLKQGETVLDLGSGGGIDVLLAAQKVGPTGKAIGVDMTPEMIDAARKNARKSGAKNVEFRLGEIEHLPAADNSVDVIISNCVINLSPEKEQVFREAYRVLKKGGRMLVSDMMASGLPEVVRKNISLWASCIGGAIGLDEYVDTMKAAGFEVDVVNSEEYSRDFIKDALESAVMTTRDKQQKTVLNELAKLYDKSSAKISHAEIRGTKS